MDTVVFSSLLIGLLAGPMPVSVEVAASAHATSVALVLDGRRVAQISSPPWQTVVDFGSELKPHEIVAIAADAQGRDVGRARKVVNVPEPGARLEILLERSALGMPSSARLVATSVVRDSPVRATLTLDGVPLALDSDLRSSLPPLDPQQSHVLSGTAEFGKNSVARADVAFGGAITDSAGSRLTSVPIQVAQGSTPTAASLRGLFRRGKETLEPVTVEKGIATIIFVRHPSSLEAERVLGRQSLTYPMKADPADRLGITWPLIASSDSTRASLFETSMFSGKDWGFFWFLTHVSRPGRAEPPFRFVDAVAAAGMEAGGSGTRRAVILVEGGERADKSRFSPEQVMPYLRRLGVPLRVWRLGGPGVAKWPSEVVEDVTSVVRLQKAVANLKDQLDRQRIVWLAGEWVPGEVELAETARGFQLLR